VLQDVHFGGWKLRPVPQPWSLRFGASVLVQLQGAAARLWSAPLLVLLHKSVCPKHILCFLLPSSLFSGLLHHYWERSSFAP
jgi:hypothetical protein